MEMNRIEADIFMALSSAHFLNQRDIAKHTGYSLGIVNKSLHNLIENKYISEDFSILASGKELLTKSKADSAIILAAGLGMRMAPINYSTPKPLIEVYGERIIERMIRQLHEAGIRKIYIVVGFMKEKFEYLIDKYNVTLLVNPYYSTRNNLYSLEIAAKYISNTYIIPGDIWCKNNPFRKNELYSWYMVLDSFDKKSDVRVNRKQELVEVKDNHLGNKMVGISYLEGQTAVTLVERIHQLSGISRYEGAFWEEALYTKDRMMVMARVESHRNYFEINTYMELKDLENDSDNLNSDALVFICRNLKIKSSGISNVEIIKKGLTNYFYSFDVNEKKYAIRIPVVNGNPLINRLNEFNVYKIISGKGLCNELIAFDTTHGYKLSEYVYGGRNCDPESLQEISACMKKLKDFHNMKLQVNHTFDLFEAIDIYEKMRGTESNYDDYKDTKNNSFSLKKYIDNNSSTPVLSHIDAIYENFRFCDSYEGELSLQLVDWEYAGLADPYIDVAMFAIFAKYNKTQVDKLIDIYEGEKATDKIRSLVYCYISLGGLLWSNFCEAKIATGIEVGEYSIYQYRYAKEYYRHARDLINKQ